MKRIVFYLVLLLLPTLVNAQNYKLGRSDDGIEEWYIMSVTNSPSTQTMTAVDRLKPLLGKLDDFREKFKASAPRTVNKKELDKLAFCKRKVQFSTKRKAYRILEISYYKTGGEQIDKVKFDEDETKWHAVPANTILDAEYKKVTGK